MEEKKTYSEKLKDPRWQKKRLEIFERDNWTCQHCCHTEWTLAIHHLRYIPGIEPWDYPAELLITLCEYCHSEEYEVAPLAMDELSRTLKENKYFCDDIKALSRITSLVQREDRFTVFEIIRIFAEDERVRKIIEGIVHEKSEESYKKFMESLKKEPKR